jgi:ABC-type dipeptide/oligopeptide/nickel transport system ATPase subunit
MTLYDQDTLGLIGESGSGKSTLAMIMGGLLYPGADKLFLNEEEVLAGQYASKSYYKKIQYILQEAESSFAPKRRVGKQLTDVISAFKIQTRSKNQMVVDFLNDLGLDKSYFNRFSHELSGGEKQRIAFARAMLVQPEILILDESFSGLDRKTLHENLKVLLSLQTKYSFAIILISHDINLIGHFCNRVIVLKEGQLIEEGLKETILSNPSDPYTKKLIEAAQIPR